MSTRSFIAKQIGDDKYKTVYCHNNGYPDGNGVILLKHYNTPEKVDALLALGDLSVLNERLYPDPNKPHAFRYEERQEGVTVAYGRDRGDKNTEARLMSLSQLDAPENWTDYVYIFTPENEWKYFGAGQSQDGLRSLRDDLDEILRDEQNAPDSEISM